MLKEANWSTNWQEAKMAKRTWPLCAIVFFVVLLAFCPGGIAGPIPSEVKSIVCFVFIERDGKLAPNGTAFFVAIKNPSKPTLSNGYFVTAKHVLYKPRTTEFLDKVYIRLNKKDGGSEMATIPIQIAGSNRTVFLHSDTSVDLAVIPFFPDQTKYDFKMLPEEFLTTKDDYVDLKIQEGSDVFFTGLFSPYTGAQRNYPVVRFGRVALVTDEKIDWDGTLMTLYLVEAGSYGGNSGAPVFFYLGSDREPAKLFVGPPVLKLAGIMQGTFLDAQEIKIVDTGKTPISQSNMGIAAVVPAYKLHELLFSEELKQQRGS
jgi:hypothetical protein